MSADMSNPQINHLGEPQKKFLLWMVQTLKGYNIDIMGYNNTTFFFNEWIEEQNRLLLRLQETQNKIFVYSIDFINNNYNVSILDFQKYLLDIITFNLTKTININQTIYAFMSYMTLNENNKKILS